MGPVQSGASKISFFQLAHRVVGGAGGQGLMASLSGPAPGGVGLDLRISGVWTTYAEGGPGGPDNEEVGTASTARGSGGYGGKGNQLDPNALLPGGDGVDGIVIVRYALP